MNRIFIATLVCLSLLAACSAESISSHGNNINGPDQNTSPGDSNN